LSAELKDLLSFFQTKIQPYITQVKILLIKDLPNVRRL
jgi:hypothetical protein